MATLSLMLHAWLLLVCEQAEQHNHGRHCRQTKQANTLHCPMRHNTKVGKLQEDGAVTWSMMLLQLSEKTSRRPEKLDKEDFDYIKDDDNPLDDQIFDTSASHDKLNFKETRAHFNCTAGAAKWSTGWSAAKKRFCCKTSGVGCLTNRTTNKSDSSSSLDGKITNTSHGISHTSGSTTNSSTQGNLSNKPHTNTINDQPTGNTPNNTADNPSDMMGNATVNVTNRTTCVTSTPRSGGLSMAATSPAGTPCIFGSDKRDEGWHCIMDAGKYGSLGWCWTSKTHSSWGPCSEHCPLFGQAGVLGKKIDAFGEDLRRFSKQILNKSMVEAKGHKTTNKNVTAKGHAIFGGIQRRKLHTR